MNAVVMDNAIIGDEAIVGALCFVPADFVVPARKIVVGNPAKIIKDVSNEMIDWKSQGTALYQSLPAQLHSTLKPCEPLREVPENLPDISAHYKTWKETKK